MEKQNKKPKYVLIDEISHKEVGTSWVENKRIYLRLTKKYENPLLALYNQIIEKADWKDSTISKQDDLIQIDNYNDLLLKALIQDSALYLKIHFIKENS